MMGPLAGIGDPVFWLRPDRFALGASLAMTGNIVGPLLFFIGWNAIRMAFLWYTQNLVTKLVEKSLKTCQVVSYKMLLQR